MVRGELPPAAGGAGLIQHRRALRRRLGQMDGAGAEIFSLVRHTMDLRRIGETAVGTVAQHRAVLPTAFPELVGDLEIVLRDLVARIVFHLLRHPHALGGAVEVAGDDVPADPALGEMIQRAHAAGKRVGVLIGQGARDAEPQILGHIGHRRNNHEGVVHRHLHRVFQRRVRPTAIHVIDAQHIREKQRVEFAAFQDARQIHPVIQGVVAVRPVARMRPQAGGLVDDAVHVEGVQAYLPGGLWGHGGIMRPNSGPRKGGGATLPWSEATIYCAAAGAPG